MAATKGIKAYRRGQEVQLFFRPNVRIGKKCDLSDFDRGMIVGARQGGLSMSETPDLLGFSCTTVSRVCRLVKADRKVTVRQISTVVSRRASLNTQRVKPLSG